MTHKIYGPDGRVWPVESVLEGVGPGWNKLVQKLIRDLFELGWDGKLLQIKEKFGGLRFYTGSQSDDAWDRINSAEDESLRTCERCGDPGTCRNGSWIKTLCDSCHEKEFR